MSEKGSRNRQNWKGNEDCERKPTNDKHMYIFAEDRVNVSL